jgi:hypothetical protein
MELGDWTEAFKASLVTEKQVGDGDAKAGGGQEAKNADAEARQGGQGTRAQVARWAKGQPPCGEGQGSKQDET